MNSNLCEDAELVNKEVAGIGFSGALEKYCIPDSYESCEDTISEDYMKTLPAPFYVREPTSGGRDLAKEARRRASAGLLTHGFRISMISPVNWMESVNYSRNIQFKTMSWIILDAPLRADSQKIDDYYQPSLSYIIDWIDAFIGTKNKNDFAWYDMAVGQRATKLAYVLRKAIERRESKGIIDKLIICAEIHVRELSSIENIAIHSNHGLFQMLGLLTLGSELPFLKSSQAAIKLSRDLIAEMLRKHFCEDGMHSEHSPVYHIYMTNFLSVLLDSDFMKSEDFKELAAKAIEASKFLVQPDGTLLGFGDTHPVPATEKAIFDIYSEGAVDCSPAGFKYFDRYGLVVHTNYVGGKARDYLAFSSSFHSRQHKHADDGNLQFYYKGEPVLVDTGTYTYNYDAPERIYVESTRAHNCLEIDSSNYSRFNNEAFGSGIVFARKIGGCFVTEATVYRKRLLPSTLANTNVSPGDAFSVSIKCKRLIVYHPERYLLVIDVVNSREEHDYTQWFNFGDGLNVEDSADKVKVFDKNNLNLLSLIPLGDNVDIRHAIGEKSPRLHGWICKDGYTLTERSAVGLSCNGSSKTLATLIDLNPLEPSKLFFKSSTKGKYIRFTLKRSGNSVDFTYRFRDNRSEMTYQENDETSSLSIDSSI